MVGTEKDERQEDGFRVVARIHRDGSVSLFGADGGKMPVAHNPWRVALELSQSKRNARKEKDCTAQQAQLAARVAEKRERHHKVMGSLSELLLSPSGSRVKREGATGEATSKAPASTPADSTANTVHEESGQAQKEPQSQTESVQGSAHGRVQATLVQAAQLAPLIQVHSPPPEYSPPQRSIGCNTAADDNSLDESTVPKWLHGTPCETACIASSQTSVSSEEENEVGSIQSESEKSLDFLWSPSPNAPPSPTSSCKPRFSSEEKYGLADKIAVEGSRSEQQRLLKAISESEHFLRSLGKGPDKRLAKAKRDLLVKIHEDRLGEKSRQAQERYFKACVGSNISCAREAQLTYADCLAEEALMLQLHNDLLHSVVRKYRRQVKRLCTSLAREYTEL